MHIHSILICIRNIAICCGWRGTASRERGSDSVQMSTNSGNHRLKLCDQVQVQEGVRAQNAVEGMGQHFVKSMSIRQRHFLWQVKCKAPFFFIGTVVEIMLFDLNRWKQIHSEEFTDQRTRQSVIAQRFPR